MTMQRGQRPYSDFSVGQLTLLGVALVILLFFAWTYVAFAEEVPTFNLHKTCKTDVLAYQGTTTGQASGQVSEQGCLRSEQSARENACKPVDAICRGQQTGVLRNPRRWCHFSELRRAAHLPANGRP